MEEESTDVVKMDKDISVTAVSEGSADFIRIKQEVDLPEDDTYYPMDFGISVEDEDEMNPVYVKMKSKEPGSSSTNLARDESKSYDEKDSEESEEESEEESDEDSSNSGEDKSGEEDGERGLINNSSVQGEEMQQPSTSKYSPAPTMTGMTSVAIKEEPMSEDEGLSYQEDDNQFAESYKMLDSLRRSCGGEGTGQSSRGAMFDSKLSPSNIGMDGVKQEEPAVIICMICGDVFDSHSDLDVHLKVSHSSKNNLHSMIIDEGKRGLSEDNIMCDVESSLSQVVRVEVTQENSKVYVCELGDEMLNFQSEVHVDLHQELSHPNDPDYVKSGSTSGPSEYDGTCRLCKKSCGNRRMYLMHLRIKHSEELQYECEVCKARYLDKEDLESYKRTHVWSGSKEEHTCEACGNKTSYSCHTCYKEFDNRPKLIKHQKVHSKGRHCYCHMCDIYFKDTRQTREHLETHYPLPLALNTKGKRHSAQENDSELHCCLDNISGRGSPAFDDVFADSTVEQLEPDPRSEFLASQSTKEGVHYQEAYAFKCPVCSQAFNLQSDYISHQKLHIPNISQSPSQNTFGGQESSDQLPTLCCVCCTEKFDSLKSLLDHPCVYDTKLMKRCPLCRKQYSNKKDFGRHIRSHGLNPVQRNKRKLNQDTNSLFISQLQFQGKTFRCTWCKKEFCDMNKLVDHTHVHFAWGRNCCPVCKKWYTNIYYFRQHLRAHGIITPISERQYKISQVGPSHQEQQIRCKWCDKRFCSYKNLAVHTDLHIVKGKNRCPVCGMWFGKWMAAVFRNHLRTHGITTPHKKRRRCKNTSKRSLASQSLKKEVTRDVMQPEKNGQSIQQPLLQVENSHKILKHCCVWCKEEFHDLDTLVNHTHEHINNGMNRCPICHELFSGLWRFKHHISLHGIIAPYKKKVWPIPGTKSGVPSSQVDKARVNLQNLEHQDDGMLHKGLPSSNTTQALMELPKFGSPKTADQVSQQPTKNRQTIGIIGTIGNMPLSQGQTSCKVPEHCCKWCSNEFDDLEELVNHTRIHISNGFNKCPVCKKWFPIKSSFKQHLKSHGIIPPFENRSWSIQHIRSTMLISQLDKQGQNALRQSGGMIHKLYPSSEACKAHSVVGPCKLGNPPVFGTSDQAYQHSDKKREFMSMSSDFQSDQRQLSSQDSVESCASTNMPIDGVLEMPQNHICSRCKLEFSTAESLSQHQCLHKYMLGIYCPLCPKWFKSKQMLQYHITIVHPKEEKLLQLDSNDEFLGPHGSERVQHQKGDNFCCEVCSESFALQSEYISHKTLHMSISTNASNECPAPETLSGVETSDQVQHYPDKVRQSIQDNTSKLQCDIISHKKVLTSSDLQTVSGNLCESGSVDEDEILCCQWCQKQFLDMNELVDHTQVHISWGRNCCPVCNKWYAHADYFKLHLRVHGIFTPVKLKQYDALEATISLQEWQNHCKWCEIQFDNLESLVAHIRLHVPRGKERCPMCGMSFRRRQKTRFNFHLSTHGVSEPPKHKGWIREDTSSQVPVPMTTVQQTNLNGKEQHYAREQNDDISHERLPLASDIQALMQDAMCGTPPSFESSHQVPQTSDEKGHSISYTSSKSLASQALKEGQQQQNTDAFDVQKGYMSPETSHPSRDTKTLMGPPASKQECGASGQHLKFMCDVCQRTFRTAVGMKSHKRFHNNCCSICKKMYRHPGQLRLHYQSFHKGSQFVEDSKKELKEGVKKQMTCIQDASSEISFSQVGQEGINHQTTGHQSDGISCKKLYSSGITKALIESSVSGQLQQNPVEEEKPFEGTSSDSFASKGQKKEANQHISRGHRSQFKVRTSYPLQILKCVWCTKEFTSVNELNAHERSHIARGKNCCPVCKKWYCNGYYFKIHLRVHGIFIQRKTKKSRSETSVKKRQPIRSRVLFPRVQATVRVPKHHCAWCSRGFADLGQLVDHTRVHISKRTNRCPVCKELFSDRSLFKEHLKTHGIIPPHEKKRLSILYFRSNITNRQAVQAGQASRSVGCHDMTNDRLHPSGDTQNLMESPTSGSLSYMYVGTSDQVQKTNVEERQLIQDTGGKSPVSEPYKNMHISDGSTKELYASDYPSPFKCQKVCDSVVNYKTGNYPYECEVCQARFPLKCEKESHRLAHSQDLADLFLCGICGQGFTEDHFLQMHMQYHEARPLCSCQVCKKTFPTGSDFDKHVCSSQKSQNVQCLKCNR